MANKPELDSKTVIREFFETTNELLNKHSFSEGFLYSWLEVLEDDFDFGSLLFYLPILEGKQVFTLNLAMEESLRACNFKVEGKRFAKYDVFVIEELQGCFLLLNEALKNNLIYNTFIDLLPFYIKQINKIDRLSKRVKLLRCQVDLKKAFENKLSIESILDCFLESLYNDFVFIFNAKQEKFIAPKASLEAIEPVKKALIPALHSVIYSGTYLKNAEFHDSIKALILYPLHIDQELDLIIGSFSKQNKIIKSLDFALICDFALDQYNMNLLRNKFNQYLPNSSSSPKEISS